MLSHRLSAGLCSAFAFLLLSCASSPREPLSIYDQNGILQEQITYDKDGAIDTRWRSIDDSTAIYEYHENGQLLADTIRTEAFRTYGVIEPERTAVSLSRAVLSRGAQGIATATDNAKSSLSSLVPYASALKDKLASNLSEAGYSNTAEAVEHAYTTAGKSISNTINKLHEVDTLAIVAIGAGYIRGLSVGFQETEDFVKAIPDATKKIMNADYDALHAALTKQIYNAQEFIQQNANLDSIEHLSQEGMEKIRQLPDYAQKEFESTLQTFNESLDSSFKELGIDPKYRSKYKGAFVSGWLTWQLAMAELTFSIVRTIGSVGNSATTAKVADRSHKVGLFERKVGKEERTFLMPREGHGGHWDKNKTHWKSDIPEVNAITGGKQIHFIGKGPNKVPDFSPWSRKKITVKGLTGRNEEDFPKMYAQLAAQKHISVSQAEQWVKQNGLTPHHLSCDEIMLVPTALHENIAHTGAASMLRNGTCR